MKRYVTIFIFLWIAITQAISQNKHASDKAIHRFVHEKMQEYKIPGLALMVTRGDKIIHQSNYGLASIEFNIPVTDSTIFTLASVTKLFTSTVIFKLQELQKLNINQPVTAFIDGLPESWETIKISNLLNHTSGIQNHFRTPEWLASPPDENQLSMNDFIQYSVRAPLQFEPGDKFSYNVTGYMLLAMIAEQVTGKKMEDVAKELLFDPLKMNDSKYGDYKTVIRNRNSLVYTYQNGPFETWNFDYGPAGTSAAGLNATTADMARFFIALNEGQVLSKQSMVAAMSPTQLNDGAFSNYGLGWTCNSHNDLAYYGHEGGGCCWINYFPDKELTIIIMSNLTGSKADELVPGIADFFMAEE